MSRRLVIVGNGQMAELFCSNFTHLNDFVVAGFAVDRRFIKEDRLLGLPPVDWSARLLSRREVARKAEKAAGLVFVHRLAKNRVDRMRCEPIHGVRVDDPEVAFHRGGLHDEIVPGTERIPREHPVAGAAFVRQHVITDE